MKLKFLIDRTKRDLKLVPYEFVQSQGAKMVKMEDVVKVLNRWEAALETEDTLTLENERFEALLNKEGRMTPTEQLEAFELLMLIHMPLVDGANDVMGVRLKDADYYRLNNKMHGRPLEEGLADYEEKKQAMIAARKEAAKRKKEQMEEDRRRGLIV